MTFQNGLCAGLNTALAANLAVTVPPISRRRQTMELAQTLHLTAAATHLRAMVAQQPRRNITRLVLTQPGRIVSRSDRRLSHTGSFAAESAEVSPFPRLTAAHARNGRGVSGRSRKKIGVSGYDEIAAVGPCVTAAAEGDQVVWCIWPASFDVVDAEFLC
jgi:hypothetical protein